MISHLSSRWLLCTDTSRPQQRLILSIMRLLKYLPRLCGNKCKSWENTASGTRVIREPQLDFYLIIKLNCHQKTNDNLCNREQTLLTHVLTAASHRDSAVCDAPVEAGVSLVYFFPHKSCSFSFTKTGTMPTIRSPLIHLNAEWVTETVSQSGDLYEQKKVSLDSLAVFS